MPRIHADGPSVPPAQRRVGLDVRLAGAQVTCRVLALVAAVAASLVLFGGPCVSYAQSSSQARNSGITHLYVTALAVDPVTPTTLHAGTNSGGVFMAGLGPPGLTTTAATNVTATSAVLTGTVNPNDTATTASFQYGLTASYGSTVAAGSFSGVTSQAMSATVTGLTCNTLYHFQATATNIGGTGAGSDVTFLTNACPQAPPTVTTNAATNVGQTTATLQGTVNPNGATTTAAFDYGLTSSFGGYG